MNSPPPPTRGFLVTLAIGYLPATIDPASERYLHETIAQRAQAAGSAVQVAIDSDSHPTVTVTGSVRGTNSVAAAATLNDIVDGVLIAAGLFEEFDVTGKRVEVRPATDLRPHRRPNPE